MHRIHRTLGLLALSALTAGSAFAWTGLGPENSDLDRPNSPWKVESGFPDSGTFNPNWTYQERVEEAVLLPSYIIISEPPPPRLVRGPRAYALVAAPTLPCAPGYCPRLRARADRN